VPAHTEIADIVEKDHARHRGGVHRLAQECPHQDIRPRGSLTTAERKLSFSVAIAGDAPHRAVAEFRPTTDYSARRLATCVRVDHADPSRGSHDGDYDSRRVRAGICLVLIKVELDESRLGG